ncbi:hypothetical protein CCMSSC00406_0000115 [Pleurotus cornucopiae]|uniref:Uncharacterized protein n=1 Tax=Pleurotus cornucopiae TaxID=5321 RepID=A0ACB7IZA4_PLECO|nr:hypothetical protein CCMSSC00406_0000115 [Pleurotus cornucopiae]
MGTLAWRAIVMQLFAGNPHHPFLSTQPLTPFPFPLARPVSLIARREDEKTTDLFLGWRRPRIEHVVWRGLRFYSTIPPLGTAWGWGQATTSRLCRLRFGSSTMWCVPRCGLSTVGEGAREVVARVASYAEGDVVTAFALR